MSWYSNVFFQVMAGHGRCMKEVAKCLAEEWHVSERGVEVDDEVDGAGNSQRMGGDYLEEDIAYLMKILDGVRSS